MKSNSDSHHRHCHHLHHHCYHFLIIAISTTTIVITMIPTIWLWSLPPQVIPSDDIYLQLYILVMGKEFSRDSLGSDVLFC